MNVIKRQTDYPLVSVRVKYDPDKGLEKYPTMLLHLEKRSENVLLREKITTPGQLMDRWDELENFRGAGVKSVREIRAAALNQLSKMGAIKLQINLGRIETEVTA